MKTQQITKDDVIHTMKTVNIRNIFMDIRPAFKRFLDQLWYLNLYCHKQYK